MSDDSIAVRRLQGGDEALLAELVSRDAEFDLDDPGSALVPLSPFAAARFLANPAVLFWVAEVDRQVQGFLYCVEIPLRSDAEVELLLYEIGVRAPVRRRGVGSALLREMERWMLARGIGEVWVCADNEVAVRFYRAGGFEIATDQPVYLTRERE